MKSKVKSYIFYIFSNFVPYKKNKATNSNYTKN